MRACSRIVPPVLLTLSLLTLTSPAVGADWYEWPVIHASDGYTGDRFGSAVAVSNYTAIVGSTWADPAGSASGAVYFFDRVGSEWVQTQRLVPSTLGAGDCLGMAVDIHGDRAIAGGWSLDGHQQGVAYIFERIDGSWQEIARLRPDGISIYAEFGSSVAIDGDFAVVGAPGASTAYSWFDAGSGFTYYREFPGVAASLHGTSVDVSHFQNFGGTGTYEYMVAIGAPAYPSNGAARVYAQEFMTGMWSSQLVLAPDGVAGDFFGESVSLDGFYHPYLAVGASDANSGLGAAYLFEESSGSFVQVQRMQPAGMAASAGFGTSVSVVGDGFTAIVLVGAPYDNGFRAGAGAAYRFEKSSSSFSQQQKLYSPNGYSGDGFGATVALDVQSWLSAVVGAPRDDDLGSYSGSAFAWTTYPMVSISGHKYDDLDGDGAYDPPLETGIEGWRIYLDLNGNDVFDAGDYGALTGPDGHYQIDEPPFGTYALREEEVSPWVRTFPAGTGEYELVLQLGTTIEYADFLNHFDANTPTGTDVTVEPEPGISVGFDEVTGGGTTTVTTSSTNPGPEAEGYLFMGTFYDINTTATYTGEVEVCLLYDDSGMTLAQELALRIFHLEDGSWVDITSSIDSGNDVICGTTSTLSPFGVAVFQPWAVDGTSPALAATDDAVGVSWGDYDRDGDPDLYVANHLQADKLFRNDGAGIFTDVTAPPLGHTGQGSVGCWADYDDDGDPDLYLAVRGGPNVLYENTQGGFVDVSSAPLNDAGESHGAAWLDYDLDGDLDVYVSNYSGANHLYRNDGGGAFTDVSAPPINHTGQTTGAAIADYDDDGDPDIFITNVLTQPNRLFRNDGGGAWSDVTPAALSLSIDSRGAAWGDCDNDGDLDLYVANGGGANYLFRNDGSNVFTDVSMGAIADPGNARGVGWQDYDNDGDLDLYVANLNGPNKLIRNEGFGIFTDATVAPLNDSGYGIGVAWADYDLDGDADLYLGNAFGPNVLFRNNLVSTNHWLHVNPSGVTSNRRGVGARIRVVAGALDQIREVQCGSGYVSEGSLTAEFGLGANATVDLLEVHWPGGAITTIDHGIGIDQVVTVSEGATAAPDLPGVTRLHPPTPNPFNPATTISFDLAVRGPVTLRVYDSRGRLVSTLLDRVPFEPGTWQEIWSGRDSEGNAVASGVYHVRLDAPDQVETKSVTLIR